MTVDDQLRDLARRADRHQTVITAGEILQRASLDGTGTSSRLRGRRRSLKHIPTGFTEEETTMVDLETSSHTAEHRKGAKLILIGCLAAAAVVAVVAVVALRDDEPDTEPLAAAEGPRIVAMGTDVEFEGEDGLAGQTLNVTAEEQDGKVTGEFRIGANAVTIECADTGTAGFVILGGAASGPDVDEGDRLVLVIREGTPDAALLLGFDATGGSCSELLASLPADVLTNDSEFIVVEDGYDIQTG